MNPSADDGQSGPRKQKPLPRELAFLKQLPDEALYESEYIEQVRIYLGRVFAHRELMQAYGLDPQRFILTLVPLLRDAQQKQAAFDAAENELLEKMADHADAQRELFKMTRQIVDALHAEKPFDPQTQELKERIDEWAKQMPKE